MSSKVKVFLWVGASLGGGWGLWVEIVYISCWNYIPFHVPVSEGPHITVRMSRKFMTLVINLLALISQFQYGVAFICCMSKLFCEKYSDEHEKQFCVSRLLGAQ